jgi:hypothetical protein
MAAVGLLIVASGSAGTVLATPISNDPYTNTSSQHKTQLEPDSFAYGNTIVATFQTGRFFDGGASNIGWATSTNGGKTWTTGMLPGTTVFEGGPWARISDPAVAYDPLHDVWMISGLAIDANVFGAAVTTSRSTDGGLTWQNHRDADQQRPVYEHERGRPAQDAARARLLRLREHDRRSDPIGPVHQRRRREQPRLGKLAERRPDVDDRRHARRHGLGRRRVAEDQRPVGRV